MVRTDVVKLSTVNGFAYRQKLLAGGSGIVILLAGVAQPGIASISKTSGEAIPAANLPKDTFPAEAFAEAIELTAGLPYKLRGPVIVEFTVKEVEEAPEAAEEAVPEEVIVDSADYEKIVEAYTDKNGRLSYDLINKDLIQFAHSSSEVAKMAADGASEEEIRNYCVGTRFRNISGNSDLKDEQVAKIAELLDEVSPKGVFREFNEDIRRRLSAEKR